MEGQAERIDDLHRNGYRIIQDPDHFCFGMDAVLLSGFARVKKGERVLDLCTGTGVIPLLLTAKTQGAYFEGLEIQPDCADMAKRSVALNELSHKITIRCGDVKEIDKLYTPSQFHVVTVNPPYMASGTGFVNPHGPKAVARHEILCNLEQVLRGAARVLVPGGRLYMVHRPSRLSDIFHELRRNSLEPKTLRLVQPYIHREPNLVLIEAVEQASPMVKVLPVLVVYNEDGSYTEEVRKIYYD